MGLLQYLTIKWVVDLSDVTKGTKDINSSVKSTGDAVSALSEVFDLSSQNMAEALGKPIEQIRSVQSVAESAASSTDTSMSEIAESAQVAGESLVQTGNDAQEMGDEVAASGEKASSGLGGFFDKIKGGASSLLDFGSKIGQTIFGLQAMGQAAVSMVGGIFSSSQQIEEATSSFQVFDGSMQKAQQEMSNLSSFAAHTPFETKDIDDAALKMQSVGISAQDVIPDLHSLGDALDATGRVSGADLSMLVDDFDKIQTQGHLTTDVMNSFALQGIDAWGILEKQTGKSRDQLGDLISKGLYPAKDAMQDLTQGIEKNPLYTGQMANDTNSMTGIMSTLKSNWDQALASFASPVMKDLEPVLNGISTDLSSSGFKDFASGVGQAVADAFGKIADKAKNIDFKAIGSDVQRLGNWFKTSLKPAIEQAEPGFEKLGGTISGLANSALPPLTKDASELIPKVVELSGDIANGLSSAIDGISHSFQVWGPIVVGVSGALTFLFLPAIIKSGVESVIAGGKIAASYVASIVKTGVEGWAAIAKIGSWIGSMTASAAQAAVSATKITATWIASMVTSGAQSVAAAAKVSAQWIASMATSAAQATASAAKITATWIASMVASGAKAVWAALQISAKFIVAMIQAGIQAGITAGTFLIDLVPAIVTMSEDAIAFAITAIPAILAGFADWAIGAAVVALANIAAFWPIYLAVAAIIAIIGLVILAVQNWGAIVSWVQGAWGALGNWFQTHVIRPIGDGFSAFGSKVHDVWNGVVSSVKGAINGVIDAINGFLSGLDRMHIDVGNVHVGFNIPMIPHLATGGFVDPGTWAIAGDPGPNSELVYGGRAGATVFSHSQSQAMLGSGGGNSGETHVHIYMDSQEIAHYTADSTGKVIVRKLLGHGPVQEAA